jgi:ubiquitin-protein ligase E3 A
MLFFFDVNRCANTVIFYIEKNTQYDGFESTSEVIKQFWEIVHAMPEEEKRQLLFFTTGSERVCFVAIYKTKFTRC